MCQADDDMPEEEVIPPAQADPPEVFAIVCACLLYWVLEQLQVEPEKKKGQLRKARCD